MKIEKPLTEDQINQIGRLIFPMYEGWKWEIYPQEKFPPESRWNGIDIVPRGQNSEDQDIWCIQINLKEDLDVGMSITAFDAEGDSYGINKWKEERIKEILK